MNIRLNIILFIIVVLLGGWYFYQQQDSNHLESLIKREGQPEYVGDKVTTSVYDTNGKAQYFAEADEIKNYEATGKVELINPLLSLFNDVNSLKEWQITSLQAEISKDKILHLIGNVKIESLGETQLQSIETDELSVNLNTQDIFTQKHIFVKGIGFSSEGIGLQGNLKQQSAQLKSNVKTLIEPTKLDKK
ncbi:Lipopolysaccharide export system protein lptC [Phocoenobacter uteri]|uniref:Lipopolysaccharide export system protein LptC n=1 Tax=Phocoenobacter uteri TaxID=146806 RepID=A0A379CAJ2_9PAST|nr:LPS export ABC transporter periplasmic protein LptC [Phocoenobacter uteri]MDG6881278.1 LPS export ABC transporter periplasmic protein LptC [Phocoenobacter uteri]SUB59303.1 Lipopolysaccharide export system protein lptC [Phocoenobacter uteri]